MSVVELNKNLDSKQLTNTARGILNKKPLQTVQLILFGLLSKARVFKILLLKKSLA